jgi:hypothetical protein
MLLTACGGGGGGSGGSTTLSGAVIDGYIEGAKVCLDVNGNLVCDTGEPSATTNALGKYSIAYSGSTAGLHVIAEIGENAKDADDKGQTIAEAGKAPFTLATPATKPQTLTPLTTLVAHEMMMNTGLSAEAAEDSVKKAHSITDSLLSNDYVAANKPNLHAVAKILTLAMGEVASAASVASSLTPAARKQIMEQARDFAAEYIRGGNPANANLVKPDVFRLSFNPKADEIKGKVAVVSAQGNFATAKASDILASGLVMAQRSDSNDIYAQFRSLSGSSIIDVAFQLASGAQNWLKQTDDIKPEQSWVLGSQGWISTKASAPVVSDLVFNGNCVSMQDVAPNQGVTAFEQYCFQQKSLADQKLGQYFREFNDSDVKFPTGALAYNITEGVSDDRYQLFPHDKMSFTFDEVKNFLTGDKDEGMDSPFGCRVRRSEGRQLIWICFRPDNSLYPEQIAGFDIRDVQGVTLIFLDPPRAYWDWLGRDVELGTKIIIAQDPVSNYAMGGRFTPKTSKTTRYFGGDTKISNLVAFNAVMKAASMPELDPSK